MNFTKYHFQLYLTIIQATALSVKSKNEKRRPAPPLLGLFLAERLAVGAIRHSGICLVSAYLDLLQRAVVGIVTMVSTLGNGAFDALICMAVHSQFLLLFRFAISMTQRKKTIQVKFS